MLFEGRLQMVKVGRYQRNGSSESFVNFPKPCLFCITDLVQCVKLISTQSPMEKVGDIDHQKYPSEGS